MVGLDFIPRCGLFCPGEYFCIYLAPPEQINTLFLHFHYSLFQIQLIRVLFIQQGHAWWMYVWFQFMILDE
ncbi:Os07g0434100 [Oryza sativa Japonica Group]|uniref:Os07g0434100 protein n=1 Tax=Oryza sativa subsp. japonica TaxID=39947 RepID=A0A0P0X508_ORYSJ|nr:hypothetical protein EE612_038823 [Oryza sativa]BAT01227.1 Os07g0434100 [Oryza sativa Japonica Group]